eukprot:6177816-Pleurochrysis_carterae.AAC.2
METSVHSVGGTGCPHPPKHTGSRAQSHEPLHSQAVYAHATLGRRSAHWMPLRHRVASTPIEGDAVRAKYQ